MFNPTAFVNSRGGGVAVLEVVERSRPAPGITFVPLRRTEIGGELLGPLAALTVTHIYRYSREQCAQVLEAAYRFPLPGDAAVTGVVVTFGETEVRAELRERQEAQAEYDQAVQRGDQAALVSRESPDVFTLRVAGLRPDEDVTVETTYVQLARPEGAGWSLRLPLTVAPRYSRQDERGAPHAGGQPGVLARDPGHEFTLDLLAPAEFAVTSTTHALELADEDGRQRVRLASRRALPDRDCVLSWQAHQDERPALHVLAHDEPAAGQVYFLALATPPRQTDAAQAVPREVVVLVDHSGSMEGPKWAAADWAVKRFLADLTERDTFALQLFHNRPRWFARGLRRADPQTVAAAVRFLEEHRDSGGTELGVALEQALRLAKEPGERSRHVIIVTDAQVSDLGRVLRLVEDESRLADRRHVSVLCIDAAPNSTLALALAERGGGVARFLTSDPAEEDIATALDEVLLDWSQPALSGLRLEVDRPSVESTGRALVAGLRPGWQALDVGDLPAGRQVWVAGRAPRGEGDALRLRLSRADGEPVGEAMILLAAGQNEQPALKQLFGARRVAGLEYLLHSGRDQAELAAELARLGYEPERELVAKEKTVYAENSREEAGLALRGLLTRESLRYGLLSAATAFVAVRREAGLRVAESVVVPNALPHGWSEDFASPPMQRATMNFRMAPNYPAPSAGSDPSALRVHREAHFLADAAVPANVSAVLKRFREQGPTPPPTEPEGATERVVYEGRPIPRNGECVLFDSTQGLRPALGLRLTALVVEFPEGRPSPEQVDEGLVLLVYAGDLASPRARVRLRDLVAQGGERPLNLALGAGEPVRLVLRDEKRSWVAGWPALRISLRS